jgi:hypothetical protein
VSYHDWTVSLSQTVNELLIAHFRIITQPTCSAIRIRAWDGLTVGQQAKNGRKV